MTLSNRKLNAAKKMVDLKTVVAIVDSRVDDYQQLINALEGGVSLMLINPDENPVASISAALAGISAVDELHIFAHGQPGGLHLGDRLFDETQAGIFRDELETWGTSLHQNACVYVYGCRAGAGEPGANFIQSLSNMLERPVAACSKQVGAAELGGTWDLDIVHGLNGMALPRKGYQPTAWQGLLELPILTVIGGEAVELNTSDPSIRYEVTLSEAATTDVTVSYRVLSGTADRYGDLYGEAGTLTIAAGDTTAELLARIDADTAPEPDESAILTLFNVEGAVFEGDAQRLDVIGTILDDDTTATTPSVFVTTVDVVEGDSGSQLVRFDVTLSRVSEQTITINYTTAPKTAASGVDFAPVSAATDGELVFLPGQTTASVFVPVFGDSTVEASELFELILSAPQGGAVIGGAAGQAAEAILVDDDAGFGFLPELSIRGGEAVELNTSDPSIRYEVTLSEAATTSVTVAYQALDGTATVGDDYYANSSGILTLAAGQTTGEILVRIDADTLPEADETVLLRLSNPTNAVFAGSATELTATGVIKDDDTPVDASVPSLVVNDITVVEGPGTKTASFLIFKLGGTTEDITGNFEVFAGTATAGADFQASSGSFTIAAGAAFTTVDVTIEDDTLVEDTETFVLKLSGVENGQFFGQSEVLYAIGEITDTDSAAETVTIDPIDTVALDEGSTFAHTVTFTDGEDSGNDGWTYSVDWDNDGTPEENGSIAAGVNGFDISRNYPDGPASSTVAVTVTDGDGESDTKTFDVTVNNVAPTLDLLGADTVDEGDTYTLTLANLVDPGNDSVSSFDIDWGDGSGEIVTSLGDLTHVYDDNADVTIRVTATDEDGSYDFSKSLRINNVAPSLGLALSATAIDEGGAVTLTITGSDPAGDSDPLSYDIDWGDGSTEMVTAATLTNGEIAHTYADDEDGSVNATDYTISVTASDDDGGSTTETTAVTVNNVAPTLDLLGDDEVNEDATYTLNLGAVTDPGSDTVTDYIVNWGDGSQDTYAVNGDVAHTYADPGNYVISVDLVDEDGIFAEVASKDIRVDEVIVDNPSIDDGGDAVIDEGSVFSRTITFTDADDTGGDGWTYSVDWDNDGTPEENGSIAAGVNGFDISRNYPDGPSSSTVAVTVTDGDGESDTKTFDVTVNNIAPTLDLLGADTVDEGDTYTLTLANLVDPGVDTVSSYAIDWGDGSSEIVTSLGDVAHVYGDNADVTIRVTATDEDGSYDFSKSLRINNVAPSLGLALSATAIDEGGAVTLTITGSDPAGDSDPLSYDIDWGDGSTEMVTAATLTNGEIAHTYTDDEDGPVNATDYTISVTASDGDGGSTTETTAVTVNNVAPTLDLLGADTVDEGDTYTLTLANLVDPGNDSVSSFDIDWGDGSNESVTTLGDVTHIYSTSGNFEISVSMIDEDGRFDVATKAVEVPPMPSVVFSISDDVVIDEGDAGDQVVSLLVTRSDAAGAATVSLNYGGDAEFGSDYGPNRQTLVEFADGEWEKTVELNVLGDTVVEPEETIAIEIDVVSGPVDFSYGNKTTSVTIVNDDDFDFNLVSGTEASDYLVGTSGIDVIRSLSGSYDKLQGGEDADQFVFGAEAMNGVRERDVILDYEVGIDTIVLTDGASVAAVRQSTGGALIFLEGDGDAIYVRGEDVTADNLTIFTDAEFDFA